MATKNPVLAPRNPSQNELLPNLLENLWQSPLLTLHQNHHSTSLELEKLKSQNLKLQLEIRKAEFDLAWLKARSSMEPSSTVMDAQSPCPLENAIASTLSQSS